MPLKRLLVYAGRYILEPDRVIVRSRRKRLAVRRERYYDSHIIIPFERLSVRASRYIPEPDRIIV